MLSLLFTCTVWFGGSVVCLISAAVLLLTATQTERQRGGSCSAWDLSFPICSITPLASALLCISIFSFFSLQFFSVTCFTWTFLCISLPYLDWHLCANSSFNIANAIGFWSMLLMDIAVWCVCHYCCFCVRCWCYCCCYCCVVYTDPSHKWPLLCCLYCCPYLWQLACAACATAGPKWRDMTMAAGLPVLPQKTEEDTWRTGGDAGAWRGHLGKGS